MLINHYENNKKIEEEIFLKIKDKNSINKNLLKLYTEKLKLTKEELNINDFIVPEYCSFNFLLELIDNNYDLNINIVNEIFRNNKYSEYQINILVKKILKKSTNKLINYIVKNQDIEFSEDNLKDLKNTLPTISENVYLKNHKNINFILKEKSLTEENYKNLLQNKNYFTLENVKKFLNNNTEYKQENNARGLKYLTFKENVIKKIEPDILENFFTFIPLDDDILEKYKDLYKENDILKNPNLTEEKIKKYINIKTNNLNNLNSEIELSKTFIKQQLKEDIKSININAVFRKMKSQKDCEEIILFYIDYFIKTKTYKEKGEDSTIFSLLKLSNNHFDFDFDFYEKIIEKLKTKENIPEIEKFDLSLTQKLDLFNKNTSEKYYNKFFNIEELKDLTDDKLKILILNEDFIDKIFKLIEKCNVPEKILIKHHKLFTISEGNNRNLNEYKINDFENLLKNQKIPEKLKNKDFYNNLNIIKIMSYLDQIENKEEANKIFEIIKELDRKEKHWFEDESFYRFLFNNSKYLINLELKEAIDLFKKSNVARSLNNYKLLSGLITLNEEKLLEQKTKFVQNVENYGLSLV